ncbi:MAG: hypothetical protein AAGJ94_14200 [Pseudomonadota bacterium]
MKRRVWVLAGLLLATPLGAEETPTSDVRGEWTGSGFVQKDEKSRKVRVRCTVEGDQSPGILSFDGACRAMLVMKRDIGATLVRDGDKYTGTYKGSDVGIAELDGVRTSPSQIVLKMLFPREVNGDAEAEMIIDHPTDDTFTITTSDKMISGVDVVTSSVTFEREGSVASN